MKECTWVCYATWRQFYVNLTSEIPRATKSSAGGFACLASMSAVRAGSLVGLRYFCRWISVLRLCWCLLPGRRPLVGCQWLECHVGPSRFICFVGPWKMQEKLWLEEFRCWQKTQLLPRGVRSSAWAYLLNSKSQQPQEFLRSSWDVGFPDVEKCLAVLVACDLWPVIFTRDGESSGQDRTVCVRISALTVMWFLWWTYFFWL